MFRAVLGGDNVVITFPAGWTKFIEVNGGAASRLSIAWKVYAGSAETAVTHAAGDGVVDRIFTVAGADTVAPIGASSTNTQTLQTTVTATTIAPLPDSLVVGVWTEECTGNTSGAPTWASYSGVDPTFTEFGTDINTTGLGANEIGFGIATGATDGAVTGARTAVVTGAALASPTNNIGVMFEIKAASAQPPSRPMLSPSLMGPGR